MTPTLFGRWQTRVFLFSTVGVLITIPFALGIIGEGGSSFFSVLLDVFLFGLGWDVLYIYLQGFRWDRDWSAVFQLLGGIWEAIFIVAIVKLLGLPGIPQDLSLLWFTIHYSCVWLGIFAASQTIMRILFPHWRFYGGELIDR
jgi:hypothetical protein